MCRENSVTPFSVELLYNNNPSEVESVFYNRLHLTWIYLGLAFILACLMRILSPHLSPAQCNYPDLAACLTLLSD